MPGQLLLPFGPASIRQARPATSPPGGGPYVVDAYASWMSDGFGNGFAITTKADTQPGDWSIVAVTESQVATMPTPPTGVDRWQLIHTNASATNFQVSIYALYNPKPLTTYTWSITGGRRSMVGATIRGADPYQLFDGTPASLGTASAATHVSNTVTTTGAWRLLLALPVLRAFPQARWIPHGAYRMWVEAVGADATTNMDVALHARPAQAAGNYTDTFGLQGGEPAIVALLAIRPFGATDPPVGRSPVLIHPGFGPGVTRSWRTSGSTDVPAAGAVTPTGAGTAAAKTATGTATPVARPTTASTGGKGATAATAAAPHSITQATTSPQVGGASAAAQRSSTAAAGRKQSAATASTPQRSSDTATGSKQATAATIASVHPLTQGTTAVIPGGPASASIRSSTTSTGKRSATAATTTGPHVNTATTGRHNGSGLAHTSPRTTTVLTGAHGAAGATTAASRVTAAATGQQVAAFVAALVGLDGGTGAGTTDGAASVTGSADGGTGSSGGHEGTLNAAGSGDGATTATGLW